MDDLEAETLFDAAKGGDTHAFPALVAPHRTRLLAGIRLRLPARARARTDPEDILQSTLVQALELLPKFEWQGQRQFGTWLTQIATNRVRRSYRVRPGDDDGAAEPPRQAGSEPSPLRQMRQEERFERLQLALDSLPPLYREVVVLARIEGLRIIEIAERLDRSPNATSMLLLRALRALRSEFGETESLSLPERSLNRER